MRLFQRKDFGKNKLGKMKFLIVPVGKMERKECLNPMDAPSRIFRHCKFDENCHHSVSSHYQNTAYFNLYQGAVLGHFQLVITIVNRLELRLNENRLEHC